MSSQGPTDDDRQYMFDFFMRLRTTGDDGLHEDTRPAFVSLRDFSQRPAPTGGRSAVTSWLTAGAWKIKRAAGKLISRG